MAHRITDADVDKLLGGLDSEARALAIVEGLPAIVGHGTQATPGSMYWPEFGVELTVLPSGAAFHAGV